MILVDIMEEKNHVFTFTVIGCASSACQDLLGLFYANIHVDHMPGFIDGVLSFSYYETNPTLKPGTQRQIAQSNTTGGLRPHPEAHYVNLNCSQEQHCVHLSTLGA